MPFEFSDLGDTVHKYLDELKNLLKSKQDEVSERNQQLEEGVFKANYDPKKPTVAPPKEDVPPHLNFSPLENASESLTRSAARYKSAMEKSGAALGSANLSVLNQKLMESERRLLDPKGLLRRPWYKHMIYAPGVYTGYGVKTIPGVREAIEQKHWEEADAEIVRVSKVLQAEAALIDEAAAELEKIH